MATSPGAPGTRIIVKPERPTESSVTAPKPGKPEKAAKPEHPLPDKPIPTMGWPAFRYRCYKLLGFKRRIPALSKREEQQRTEATHKFFEKLANRRLRQLADETPRATFAFINAKGAAATTTTTVFAATNFANQTRAVLVVLDANPASGTSAARLGKDYGETLSTQELATSLDESEDFRTKFSTFIQAVRPTRYGVRPITATPIVTGQNRLPADRITDILTVTQQQCEYLFVDTANDITEPVTRAVAEAADVFVFTANVAVHDSLRQLATTMETMRQQGHADKVNNAVVVISNLPAGAELADYRKYLNRVSIRDEVIEEYPFNGPFLGIPHDPEIARDREVDLDTLQWETLQTYRELDIVMLEQAAKHFANQSKPTSPEV